METTPVFCLFLLSENELRKKFAFSGVIRVCQSFEKLYKIKVKDWTFLYLVLGFYSNANKIKAARAFSVFVGQTEASVGIFATLDFRNFGSLAVGQTNVPLTSFIYI